MFDLTIFPLSVDSGREQYELPGLLVMAAARKSARMRAQDHLLLYCRFIYSPISGKTAQPLTPAQQQEILTKLAGTYFSFSGSVTAGMRAVAARLNEFLLNRNLRASQDVQTVGMLNMAVLHGSSLIVAHAGITHTYVLTKTSAEHYDDSAAANTSAGRGLGLSRVAIPRFYQAELTSGDLIVMCDSAPVTWNAHYLDNSTQLTFDHFRRRMLIDGGDPFQAAVIRFEVGKGQVSYWKPSETVVQPGDGRLSRAKATLSPVESDLAKDVAASRDAAASLDAAATRDTAAPSVVPSAPVAVETPSVQASAPTHAPDAAAPGSDPRTTSGRPGIFIGSAATPVDNSPHAAAAGDNVIPAAPDVTPVTPDTTPVAPRATPVAPNATPVAPTPVAPRPRTPVQSTAARSRGQAVQTPLPSALGNRREGARARRGQRTVRDDIRRGLNDLRRKLSQPAAQAGRTSSPATGPGGAALRRFLAPIWKSGQNARSRTSAAFARAEQSLPRRHNAQGQEIPFFNLSKSAMLAIALVIPLVMAAIASTVYFRAGRQQQSQLLYLQAAQAAQLASQQADTAQQKLAWERVYQLAEKAEAYQSTDEARALKEQALTTLDGFDGIVRLKYQPAVTGGFASDVKITRIVATINDVYLLDSGEGRIFRLYRTSSGYEVDTQFVCGGNATKVGTSRVGQLVDIVSLPPNNIQRVSIMGIDTNGTLVLCKVGADGFDSRTLTPPDAGWGAITAMTANGETLYVLDPKANAVYRYDPNDQGDYAAQPHLYFDSAIPKMSNVIDLAVDEEFLYLLHSDGSTTLCESSIYADPNTKCTDPINYGDSRAGYDPAPLSFPGTQFLQIETTQPPDPSIYALDAKNRSVYHFSLRRLNLQRQYLPHPETDFPLPSSAPTAFTITPNRRALVAFDNQVFFAPLP